MPATKDHVRRRRAPARTEERPATSEPPVIEALPLHKEAFYAGLGLLDWTAERVLQLPGKLRRFEKQLVGRGCHPRAEFTQQIQATCSEITRRGREFPKFARDRIRDAWNALRGSAPSSEAGAGATTGAT